MSPRCRLMLTILAATLLAACTMETSSQPAITPQAAATTSAPTAPTTPSGTPAVAALPPLQLPAPPEVLAALAGSIAIDGSSTVFPITEAAATAFRAVAPDVAIQLGVSGTSAGLTQFCAGALTIANASRPIKAAELEACAANGIAFVELPVAYDGLAVVVNGANSWAECLSTDELRRIWEPGAERTINSWRDVRADWPAEPLILFGAGPDSGTFDYFTAAIMGEEGAIRADYTGSEDDYLLAQDLAANTGGMAFFGLAYAVEYAQELRTLAIDNGAGCVAPTEASIAAGSYQPLARPIFIYVRADALARPEVNAFVEFYLQNAERLVREARYVALPRRAYELVAARAADAITGSVFEGDLEVGVSIEQLLMLEEGK